MKENNCKCEETKSIAKILVEYLKTTQKCILEGEQLTKKDHEDIIEVLNKADKILENKER